MERAGGHTAAASTTALIVATKLLTTSEVQFRPIGARNGWKAFRKLLWLAG
jgi:hypothetical protein